MIRSPAHYHSEPWSGYREWLFHYLAALGAGAKWDHPV